MNKCNISCKRREAGLNTVQIGTLSELYVVIDLIKKGYEVFRGVNTCQSCDLLILKNGTVKRVEVTTGSFYKDGNPKTTKKKESTKNKFDILAVYVKRKNRKYMKDPNIKIYYFPEDAL